MLLKKTYFHIFLTVQIYINKSNFINLLYEFNYFI